MCATQLEKSLRTEVLRNKRKKKREKQIDEGDEVLFVQLATKSHSLIGLRLKSEGGECGGGVR